MALRNVTPIQQLRQEMDRLWSGLLANVPDGPWSGLVRGQPAVNVWEKDDSLMVEMELPGLKNDELEVSVVGDELSIKVRRAEPQQEGLTYHRRERPVGEFARILRLPVEVEAEHVDAELRDGVLSIKLPKAERARPRKISVVSA